METRNVTLTLKKAKEFYNSGNAALKEVALQAFTQEELTPPKYTDIKSFKDACKALNLSDDLVSYDITLMNRAEAGIGAHLVAIYKLDIIRKALNNGWNPRFTRGSIYSPYIQMYPYKKAKLVADKRGWSIGPSLRIMDKEYTLIGGECTTTMGGLSNFWCYGDIEFPIGLLGCRTKEIAEYMGKNFMREIFEATYANHTKTYQWI